jgi:uncharacterized membrane protein
MSKFTPTVVLDAALDKIATATIMTLCSAQPTTRTEAVTTFALASVTMASGDFTKAAGDTSGRKVTMAAKSGISVTASGTATHVALCDGTQVLHVTTVTSQAVTSGNTANIAAWKAEFADVTNP